MTVIALLTELHSIGARTEARGDRLHVEARPGTITPDLRDRLVERKPELLAFLNSIATLRTHLRKLADEIGVDNTHVDERSGVALAEYQDATDDELRSSLRAWDFATRMDAGQAPASYTKSVQCAGCGPVLLWSTCPDRLTACPWCFRRKAGKRIPRPTPSDTTREQCA